jgi:hypothetical protein
MERTAPDGDSLKVLHGCNQLELTMFVMLDSIGPQWAAAPDTTSTENFREAAQLLVRRRLVAARDETIVQCSENGQRMRFVLCLTGDWSEPHFCSALEECFPQTWRVDPRHTHHYNFESGRWLEFRLGSKADVFRSVIRRASAREAFDWLYSQPSPAAISVESHELLANETHESANPFLGCEIDVARFEICRNGGVAKFTKAMSFRLATAVLAGREYGIDRNELYRTLWDDADRTPNALDQHKSAATEPLSKIGLEIETGERWKMVTCG